MVKLGHKGGAAIQLDRGPYKREKHQERIYMEKRPWADNGEEAICPPRRGLGKNQTYQHPNLRLSASRNVRK